VLALTDHDAVSGLPEACEEAAVVGVTLIRGAELSVSWESHTLHVLGLRIDPTEPALVEGLQAVRAGRDLRARKIGAALADAGIPGAFEGALRHVTSEHLISRTHFARYLVECGRAREVKDVFKRYLIPGKPGYVPHAWATMTQAVGWIRGAGGQAVLAHPGRYKVTATGMRRLLEVFRAAGGDAIEVMSPSHTTAQISEYASYARAFGLKASLGSDYHGPGESFTDLGDLPHLPSGVTPVWQDW